MTNAQTLSRTIATLPSALLPERELPVALSRALVEFGLLASFRSRARSLQREYVEAVASAPARLQAERIAEVLDELALTSPLYRSEKGIQS